TSVLTPSASGSPSGTSTRAAQVDWPQYHGRPDHLGFNRQEDTVGADNVSSLGLSWIGDGATNQEDLVYRSSPTVVGGFVYFGTDLGQLLVFPAQCDEFCEPAWRLD